jgi:DNA-binding response OmpR family regulator
VKTLFQILVIDADNTAAHHAAGVISQAGHIVDLAYSEQEAMDALQKNTYDLVLTEVHLIDIGLLSRFVRTRLEFNRQAPLMALTIQKDSEIIRNCLGLGIGNVIQKPLTQAKLLAALSLLTFKQKKQDMPSSLKGH